VVHVPFKLSRTSTSFKFSQASTSSSVLTTLDICQHYAKACFSNHVLTPCQKCTQPPHYRLKRRASTNTSHRNVSPWTFRLWWTARREAKAGLSDLAGKCWMMTIAPAIMVLIACSSGPHVWVSATLGRIARAEMYSTPSVSKRLCAWRKLKMWL